MMYYNGKKITEFIKTGHKKTPPVGEGF